MKVKGKNGRLCNFMRLGAYMKYQKLASIHEVSMNKNQRSSLTLGAILVILGAFFIASNLIPAFHVFLDQANAWPLIIEAVALGFLLLGLVLGVPDMAVPAVIIGGIGGILWWQSLTLNWWTWSFMWALIPGFAGLGMLLAKVLGGNERYNLWHALNTIGSSLIIFVIFGAFFGGFKFMGPYWPVVLIAAGLLMGARTFIRNR
jgi:uncharacterized integral membrane protein